MARKGGHTLARQSRGIEPRECVLIVCEGKKTEPNYFNQLRKELRLTSAHVRVVPHRGSAAITVVDTAIEQQLEKKHDQIWCVFDVEQYRRNTSLVRALGKARDNGLNVALSNPCFEYWILLHFDKTGSSFDKCDKVIRAVKKHMPKYEKGNAVSNDLIARRSTAIHNAKAIERSQWHGVDDKLLWNPSTDVYKLVEYLDEMAARRPY